MKNVHTYSLILAHCAYFVTAETLTTPLSGFLWPERSTLFTVQSTNVQSTALPTAIIETRTIKTSIAHTTAVSTISIDAAGMRTITIDVGRPGAEYKFIPDSFQADIGDVVAFQFFPGNHSVVRAEYKSPCEPYENVTSKDGFFSGFQAVASGDEPRVWSLRINDTEPVFFYCSAPHSCNHQQMVGLINPNGNVSLDIQKELALDQPDEPSSQSSSTPSPEAHFHTSLSNGAIVGISLAGLLILTLAAALFFFIGRARSLKQEVRRRNSTISPLPASAMYQHHSIFSPHSDGLTSPGSRNSAMVYGPYDYGRDAAPEYSYQGPGSDGAPPRSRTASPGPDWAHARSTNLAPDTPVHHASVLSNLQMPQSSLEGPQEMDATDRKQARE